MRLQVEEAEPDRYNPERQMWNRELEFKDRQGTLDCADAP